MSRKRIVLCGLMLLLASSVALAAVAEGTWVGTLHTNEGGEFNVVLTLRSESGNIAGTFRIGDGAETALQEATFTGDHLSFSIPRASRDKQSRLVFSGTIARDEMNLTRRIEGSTRTQEVKLVRQH